MAMRYAYLVGGSAEQLRNPLMERDLGSILYSVHEETTRKNSHGDFTL